MRRDEDDTRLACWRCVPDETMHHLLCRRTLRPVAGRCLLQQSHLVSYHTLGLSVLTSVFYLTAWLATGALTIVLVLFGSLFLGAGLGILFLMRSTISVQDHRYTIDRMDRQVLKLQNQVVCERMRANETNAQGEESEAQAS